MRTNRITIKNIEYGKYKKHDVWLNDFSYFEKDKIERVCVMEQGRDNLKDFHTKEESIKEYAIVKVYFN